MDNDSVAIFRPTAEFMQTCGICGTVFRVEIESKRLKEDQQMYSCPHCGHHLCRINSPRAPRITLISVGRGGTRDT